jgi:diguanylate cyclase (GGDEF)-like protein
LVQVSNRLISCVRVRDTVGRLGGDEFAILLSMHDRLDAAVIATKIRTALHEPFT